MHIQQVHVDDNKTCEQVPEPPLREVPRADPLHAALQVEQSCDGLFQTLFIFLVLTLFLQLLWKQQQKSVWVCVCVVVGGTTDIL